MVVAWVREEITYYDGNLVDQDGLWKKVIGELFEDFLLFFAPALHEQVDFAVEVNFLQQELFEQIVKDKSGRRLTDQLVKVHLKDGKEKWILVHVEVQSDNEKAFAKRMFQYFYRIYDRYDKEIVTLAIMTSPHRSEKPAEFRYDYFGTKIYFSYNDCKLVNYSYPELEQSDKLFSKIVLAAKCKYDTKDDAEKCYSYKEKLMRELIKDNRYSDREIRAAIYFVDYLLRLPEDLTKKLNDELTTIIREEGYGMVQYNSGEWSPTMEAVFANIHEKAEKEGIEQGVKKVVLEMLKEGASLDFIIKVTKLGEEEIEMLRETLK